MKKTPKVLDAIADVVLAYRPKPKSEPAKERRRKRRRNAALIFEETLKLKGRK